MRASSSSRDPFRGAAWAGVRKGLIRGINWGAVGVFTTAFEEMYGRVYNGGEY